jgi:hypothetical protein
MSNFNIPDFLRLIGKGPEQKPKHWGTHCGTDYPLMRHFPYANILTDWTPEKDALLLGVGLEYCRSFAGPSPALATPEAKLVWQKLTDNGHSWYTLVFHCYQPGLTLARAIWAAMKGDSHESV